MSRSILIQLARDSIAEVYEARRSIDKKALTQEHPLLNENIKITLNLYIDEELKGSYTSTEDASLLSNIIIGAKKAAFEDKQRSTLTTSEYLHCEMELMLYTPDGVISERDPALIHSVQLS